MDTMGTYSRLGATGVVLIALLAAPAAGGGRPKGSGSSGPPVTFSGQATAVRASVAGISTVISDTGPLPSSGGALEASLLEASIPGLLTAEVLHAATVGQGDRARSEASAANVTLSAGTNTISASVLMARATAVCTRQGAGVSGSSEVLSLVVNGQGIAVTGEPNQTIDLPGGRIVINEQTASQSTSMGDITVNALHVVVDGLVDVVVASAHADVVCHGKPICEGGDFVTGGGWITGTPSGARGNFGVAGGIKNGALWGHLTYIDHGAGLKVKGTGVTAYVVVDDVTRHIEGTAEINGQGGSYQVEVADNGEPGRDDAFSLHLSNGYRAAGNLDGGNIQLHRPCR